MAKRKIDSHFFSVPKEMRISVKVQNIITPSYNNEVNPSNGKAKELKTFDIGNISN